MVLPEGINPETDKKEEPGSYCWLMRGGALGRGEVDDDNHDDWLDDVIGSLMMSLDPHNSLERGTGQADWSHFTAVHTKA